MKPKGQIKYNVAENAAKVFEQDLENERIIQRSCESLNERLNNCPSISKEDQSEPSFEYVR